MADEEWIPETATEKEKRLMSEIIKLKKENKKLKSDLKNIMEIRRLELKKIYGKED